MKRVGDKYVDPKSVIAVDVWVDYGQGPCDSDYTMGTKLILATNEKLYIERLSPEQVYKILFEEHPTGTPAGKEESE